MSRHPRPERGIISGAGKALDTALARFAIPGSAIPRRPRRVAAQIAASTPSMRAARNARRFVTRSFGSIPEMRWYTRPNWWKILGRIEPGRIRSFILGTAGVLAMLLYSLACDPCGTSSAA